MKIIDLHQDLIPYLEEYEKDSLIKNQTSWDGLVKNNIKILLPTANSWEYFNWENQKPQPKLNDLITINFEKYNKEVKERDSFVLIKNKNDFGNVLKDDNKTGLILHLEGVDYFEDKKEYWDLLEKWYEMGWRSIGIVWNIENSLAGGTNTPEIGLKDLGKKVLKWAISKNMVIDYAHMNEKLFWEVRKFLVNELNYSKPVYVSHSAVRKFYDNDRNLTDEQLEEIKKTNGIVGLFFSYKYMGDKNTTINDFLNQVDYIKNKIGIDFIGIGSDLGGFINNTIEGLSSVNDIQNLELKLKERGYSQNEIEKIFYKNALRVLREFL